MEQVAASTESDLGCLFQDCEDELCRDADSQKHHQQRRDLGCGCRQVTSVVLIQGTYQTSHVRHCVYCDCACAHGVAVVGVCTCTWCTHVCVCQCVHVHVCDIHIQVHVDLHVHMHMYMYVIYTCTCRSTFSHTCTCTVCVCTYMCISKVYYNHVLYVVLPVLCRYAYVHGYVCMYMLSRVVTGTHVMFLPCRDISWSSSEPDLLATCAVDTSFNVLDIRWGISGHYMEILGVVGVIGIC